MHSAHVIHGTVDVAVGALTGEAFLLGFGLQATFEEFRHLIHSPSINDGDLLAVFDHFFDLCGLRDLGVALWAAFPVIAGLAHPTSFAAFKHRSNRRFADELLYLVAAVAFESCDRFFGFVFRNWDKAGVSDLDWSWY